MKKNVIRIIFCLTIILCSITAYAAPRETYPRDFRGIKWGSHFIDNPGFREHSGSSYLDILRGYTRQNDRPFVGDVPLKHPPLYVFYRNQFLQVLMDVESGIPAERVLKVLESTFGKPDEPYPRNVWEWLPVSPNDVRVYLVYDDDNKRIIMANRTLYEEYLAYSQTTQRDF